MTKKNTIMERVDNFMETRSSTSNSHVDYTSSQTAPQSQPTGTAQSAPNPSTNSSRISLLKTFFRKVGAELFVFVLVGLFAWIFTPIKEVFALPEQFDANMAEINSKLDVLNALYSSYSDRTNMIDNKLFELARGATKLSYIPSDEMTRKIENTLNVRNDCFNDTFVLQNTIVTDINGVELDSAELASEKLLLFYKNSNNQDVFFYGQFDSNGAWDGHCIVNTYENKKLLLITDAEYSRGDLITYQQVFPDVTSGRDENGTLIQDDIWVVSNRVKQGDFSTGETWHYYRAGSFEQTFEPDAIAPENIISVRDFKNTLKSNIEGYYSGNTSNNYFNDDTGQAYLVKFFVDGTVKTLYFGNFANGQFEDNTGNAWMIGKKSVYQEAYAYYKGSFSEGKAVNNDKSHWRYSLSQEFIEDKIKGKSFGCELRWEAIRV